MWISPCLCRTSTDSPPSDSSTTADVDAWEELHSNQHLHFWLPRTHQFLLPTGDKQWQAGLDQSCAPHIAVYGPHASRLAS
ncbi:hypothetical protein RRG08_053703 [Elysia crispata]|uniref:Uncharacterized protein n=1 Tax=Elysia crispata TaxID=231223 RepID=A0AAE1DLU2_9GAST|nr:hypothetical protein RRG08_053703 [Elysia crispata]